jgi:hypothetical protein
MALNLSRLRFENPVLTKELRTRMRGARAYWILFTYLLLLSLILFFSYLAWWQSQRNDDFGGGQAAFSSGDVLPGRAVYAKRAGGPYHACAHGRKHLDRARTAHLRNAVSEPAAAPLHRCGKLWAATAFIALLLTAGLPLVSLCFLLGGVSPGEVFGSYGCCSSRPFCTPPSASPWSAIAKKTATATCSRSARSFCYSY